MSKPNDIRKKALEYAKKRLWDKALEEYIRLAEADAQNPNVYNELGDLYLQNGNKVEAFKAFHAAVDAYDRMSLFNNAVAVCKKIIRLNSVDRAVYGKLARLRNKQGLKKEAAEYAVTFIEKMEKDPTADPNDTRRHVAEIAQELGDVPEVLERTARYLTLQGHADHAARILEQLVAAYQSLGMQAEAALAHERLTSLGDGGTSSSRPAAAPLRAAEPLVDKARVEPTPAHPAPSAPAAAAQPVNRWAGASPYDVGSVELRGTPAAAEAATATQVEEPAPAAPRAAPRAAQPSPPRPEPAARPSPPEPETPEPVAVQVARPEHTPLSQAPPHQSPSPPGPPPPSREPLPSRAPATGPPRPLTDTEVWIPAEDLPEGIPSSEDGGGRIVQVSELVSHFHAEVKADVDAEDYRSRYDLGMAYLEMDLITEAIREFQFASNSSMYQVRSLELIGLCFIKQNQPRLAVKQLEKGLSLVGSTERDAIGIYYNLGLAYEMMGDHEKAKRCFEEVYVIDVGFRDVAAKVKALGR